MKFKILVLAALPILFGLTLPFFQGCDRPAPLMPPIPTPQVIWANGSVGTWFTNTLTANLGGFTSASVTAVNDPISGDSNALLLTATAINGFYYLQAPVTVNPSNYYFVGHMQFDILLGQPASNIPSISLEYVDNGFGGSCGDYNLPTTLINSFSTTSFTHVSIPFTSFTVTSGGGCSTYGYSQTSVDTPFEISWPISSSATTIIIDNIQWTYN